MRKLLLIFVLSLSVLSCSSDDDSNDLVDNDIVTTVDPDIITTEDPIIIPDEGEVIFNSNIIPEGDTFTVEESELAGEWEVTDLTQNISTPIITLTGTGVNIDATITITDNPNDFAYEGNIDVSFPGFSDQPLDTESLDLNGEWTLLNDNILTVDDAIIFINSIDENNLVLTQKSIQTITESGITSETVFETVVTLIKE